MSGQRITRGMRERGAHTGYIPKEAPKKAAAARVAKKRAPAKPKSGAKKASKSKLPDAAPEAESVLSPLSAGTHDEAAEMPASPASSKLSTPLQTALANARVLSEAAAAPSYVTAASDASFAESAASPAPSIGSSASSRSRYARWRDAVLDGVGALSPSAKAAALRYIERAEARANSAYATAHNAYAVASDAYAKTRRVVRKAKEVVSPHAARVARAVADAAAWTAETRAYKRAYNAASGVISPRVNAARAAAARKLARWAEAGLSASDAADAAVDAVARRVSEAGRRVSGAARGASRAALRTSEYLRGGQSPASAYSAAYAPAGAKERQDCRNVSKRQRDRDGTRGLKSCISLSPKATTDAQKRAARKRHNDTKKARAAKKARR